MSGKRQIRTMNIIIFLLVMIGVVFMYVLVFFML